MRDEPYGGASFWVSFVVVGAQPELSIGRARACASSQAARVESPRSRDRIVVGKPACPSRGAGTLWLDEAELVAVDVGEHDRTGAGAADVETRSAEREEVIERGLLAGS
jgi:hypothetical protein